MNENQYFGKKQEKYAFTLSVEYIFSPILKVISLTCTIPFTLLWIEEEKNIWVNDESYMKPGAAAEAVAFCNGTTVVYNQDSEDLAIDQKVPGESFLNVDSPLAFYTAYAVKDFHGNNIGALFLFSPHPLTLTPDQKDALHLLENGVVRSFYGSREVQELKQYKKLLLLSDSLVFIGNTDGYFRKVNPAFEKILGWEEDCLLNTVYTDFIHPDDLEPTLDEFKKLAEGQVTTNFTQRFKTKSGDYKIIEWTSYPDPFTGNIFGIGRDITEENRKVQELAISEQKLGAFLAHSNGLLCTHDLFGKLLFVNEAAASNLGYTVAEICRLTLFDIVPQTRHPLLIDYLSGILQNGKFSGQMVTKHKDGSLLVWLFNNVLQLDASGEDYIIGNALDITARYQLEKDLQRTKEILDQTNHVARVGGWELDVLNQKVFWTSVTKEIHGVPLDFEPDLVTGINFYKEGESRERIAEVINAGIRDGASWDLELQIVNLQGEEIWVRSLGNADCEDGVCKRIYGTFQDINDFKHTEFALTKSLESGEELNEELLVQLELVKEQDHTIEKIKEFKFLGDSIPEIIYTAEPDGSITYYNQYWYDFTGLTLEETQGWGWESILHPDDLVNCNNKWKEALRSGGLHEVEYRLKRAIDGAYIWYLGRAMPMKDDDGNIIKWFGFCTDIDVYKKALDLESKISQYEDFNRIVAHNLRGPAGSIGMMLEMIADMKTDKEKDDLIEMLKRSSSSLNQTLDELMKVLKVRSNIDLPFEICDLQELMVAVEAMLKGQILSKRASITTVFNVASINFPKIYLESIFYNLISNSLKYSKTEYSPEILITSEFLNGRTILIFKDNGLGIDLKRHGDNMFKLNKVFHRGFDSKGVGLFMTKMQIETFGGRISVTSEPNKGTEFRIEL